MHAPALAQPQRRWLSIAIVGALALNSVAALAAPFAYIPSSNSGINTFTRVDLADKGTLGPFSVSVPQSAPGQTGFFGVALNDATGQLFIADPGHGEGVYQLDIRNAQNNANLPTKFYSTNGRTHGITVDHNGRHVYAANFDGTDISIIDTAIDTSVHPDAATTSLGINISNGAQGFPKPYDVKLNLAGTIAYVSDSSVNQRLCKFSTASPPIDAGIPVSDCVNVGLVTDPDDSNFGSTQPSALAISPDGSRVYVLGQGDSSISVVDTTTPTMTQLFSLQPGIGKMNGIAIDRSGKRAFTGTVNGHLLTLDLSRLEQHLNPVVNDQTVNPTNANDVFGNLQGVAISADNTLLLVVDNEANELRFFNISGAAPVYTGAAPVVSGPVALGQFTSPDDRIFVSEIGSSAAGG